MFVNRNDSVYRSRNVVLMAISAFGIWVIVLNILMRDYIGRDIWPCDLLLWLSYLSLGLWLGPYTVQLLQVSNLLRKSSNIDSLLLNICRTSRRLATD
jgi:hypothetical protein